MRTAWTLGTSVVAIAIASAWAGPAAAATWQPQSSGTATTLRAVSCVTTSACVAVGDAGTIRATSDGGNVWTGRTSGTSDSLYGVSCPASSVCIAVGEGGTIRASADGGTSWVARTSGTSFALNGISCATATMCAAVGHHGTIITTTDGGSTWILRDYGGPPENLWGVSCSTASSCVAVGNKGKIFATTDGGTSWSAQNSGAETWLGGVSCPSASICVAVGYAGSIFTTVNGGATWSARWSGAGSDFEAVTCASVSSCVAVGQAGTIRSTANGGASWTAETSGTAAGLWGVACPAAGTCYAVGDAGTIRATNGSSAWQADATGAIDVQFRASGTLPAFPCPQGGCSAALGGMANGGGDVQAKSGGAQYDAAFAFTNATLTGTAAYTEPDAPFCPGIGFAAGTVVISGPATGVVERSDVAARPGSVTSVRLELSYTYERAAAGAVITITGGTATVSFTLPGTSTRQFMSEATGRGTGAFIVDAAQLEAACADPQALPFTVTGDAALTLTP